MDIFTRNKTTKESIINDDIIKSNNNIIIKEVPMDGMDLLSNKKKMNDKEEDDEEEELSDMESLDEEEYEDGGINDEEIDEEELEEVSEDEDEEVEYEEENNINDETFEDIQKEKQELLFKLNRLQNSGAKLSRQYTMDSKIEDIRSEYRTLKKQRDLQKSVKFSREMLMACVGGIEFLNGKFDPLDVKLEGWSESIMENIDNYDEVFEELYDKYNEKVDVAPEIRLIMMVGGSAFMYHLTNSLFKSAIPNVNDILKQNPDLMRNIQQATMNTMNNNPQTSQNSGMFANMMGTQRSTTEQPRRPSSVSNSMKGPSGVDDILNQIHNQKTVKLDKKRGINLGI
jgi:hypothetical protein